MKILVVLFAFLIITENVFSQRLLDQNQIKSFYLEKSKKQNTTGWILLGAGSALIVGGGYAFDKSWNKGSVTATDISGFAVLTGVIADLASIFYFISAGHNKKKAVTFSLNYQSLNFRCDNSYQSGIKPVVVFRINF